MTSKDFNRMADVYYVTMSFCAGDIDYPAFEEKTSHMRPLIAGIGTRDDQPKMQLLPKMPDADELISGWVFNACEAFATGACTHSQFLYEAYNAFKAYNECRDKSEEFNPAAYAPDETKELSLAG